MVYSKTLVASVLAAAVPGTLANLYLTSPVATTTCTGGQPCQVAWNDDGQQPSLAQFGPCTVGLYVGSVTTQVLLQDLGSVDVSQTASASFVPQAVIGPNDNIYFIRFSSETGKDATNNNYPYQGFSAKFTLAGMTGTFNSTIQSIISSTGTSTAGPPAATPSTGGGSGGVTTTTKSTKQSSTPSSSASPSSTSNAAFERASIGSVKNLAAVGLAGLTAVVAALAL